MKIIKFILGPIGNKKIDKIVYIFMGIIYITLLFQFITECDYKSIISIMANLLLSFISLAFFRVIYRNHFLK